MNWDSTTLYTDFRYVRVNRNWQEGAAITDITGGSISRKYLSTLKDGASFDYSNTFQLGDIGNDYLRVYLDADDGIEQVSIPLGTFLVSTPSQTVTDKGTSGSATGYSILQILQDEYLDATLTIPAGTNLIEYAKAVIERHELNCVYTPSDKVSTADSSFTTDDSWLDVVVWCTQGANYGTPLINGYGTIVLEPYTDPAGRSPNMIYNDASKVLFPEVTHELDTFSIPNKIVVVCSNADDAVTGFAVNDNPNDPLSIINRRTITQTYSIDNIETVAEANTKAASLLSELSSVESVEFEHLYNGSNLQDVVAFSYAQDFGVLNIVNQDLTLDKGCPVKERARRFV